MTVSRRTFLAASASTIGVVGARSMVAGRTDAPRGVSLEPGIDARAGTGYDPWLEIDPAALTHNVRTVARQVGGRPIFAVVKNNAYGLGLALVGPLFDRMPEIAALAVVRPDEALALRDAGVNP